jgi:hypothetical protein
VSAACLQCREHRLSCSREIWESPSDQTPSETDL